MYDDWDGYEFNIKWNFRRIRKYVKYCKTHEVCSTACGLKRLIELVAKRDAKGRDEDPPCSILYNIPGLDANKDCVTGADTNKADEELWVKSAIEELMDPLYADMCYAVNK